VKQEEIQILLNLRQRTIAKFDKLRDYKNNKNALMKEVDHARTLHDIIVQIDQVLKEHVNFSDKK
tara:strand:- start:858 stop:1052 length:195 start_codon:yes stop_codon:yes gene_type:complete